jgi:UDP-N-acetylmuramate--alanine ligase
LELPEVLSGLLQDEDIVLTLGAGSIGAVAAQLGKELEKQGRKGQ